MKKIIIYIFTTFAFLFPARLWASPYPECDVHPTPPSRPNANYKFTRYVSMDSDIVIRFSGNFTSMYYYFDENSSNKSQTLFSPSVTIESPYQYLGGNAALLLLVYLTKFGVGVEQTVGAVYPYSGSSAHLYGTSYLVLSARFLLGSRSVLTTSVEGGVIYSLKNENDIKNRLIIKSKYGFAAKADLDWTIYLTPDFGVGLHFSPSVAIPDIESKFWMIESGLHLTVKY